MPVRPPRFKFSARACAAQASSVSNIPHVPGEQAAEFHDPVLGPEAVFGAHARVCDEGDVAACPARHSTEVLSASAGRGKGRRG